MFYSNIYRYSWWAAQDTHTAIDYCMFIYIHPGVRAILRQSCLRAQLGGDEGGRRRQGCRRRWFPRSQRFRHMTFASRR